MRPIASLIALAFAASACANNATPSSLPNVSEAKAAPSAALGGDASTLVHQSGNQTVGGDEGKGSLSYLYVLEVVNGGTSDELTAVSVYIPGEKTPLRTLFGTTEESPVSVAVAPNGNLYVAESHGACAISPIEIYTPGGERLIKRITRGLSGCPGQAQEMAFDGSGRLYTANFWNLRLNVYNKDGAFAKSVQVGSYPDGLAVSPAGDVYTYACCRLDANPEAWYAEYNSSLNLLMTIPVGENPAKQHGCGEGSVYMRDDDLYTASNCVRGDYKVEAFHVGAAEPFLKITDGLFDPAQVLVSPGGSLYVLDGGYDQMQGGLKRGRIVVYRHGEVKPYVTLSKTQVPGPMVMDGQGRLYAFGSQGFYYPSGRGQSVRVSDINIFPAGKSEPYETVPLLACEESRDGKPPVCEKAQAGSMMVIGPR